MKTMSMSYLVLVTVVALAAVADDRTRSARATTARDVVRNADPKSELRRAFEEKKSAAMAVFIPGILGSQLRIDTPSGVKVFGKSALESWWLFYEPGSEVSHATLNEFGPVEGTIIPASKIYGPGLDELRTAMSGNAPKEFSYDWRADVRVTAEKLDQYFRTAEFKGRDIVIVAHSMGGLIAWQWLKSTPPESRPVRVSALVLVGSPLQGSCEALKTLIDGYSAIPNSKIWESVATRWLFRDAHGAMFSFPSLFQLMPRYDPEHPCIEKRGNMSGRKEPQNHHSEGFWMGRETKPTTLISRFNKATRRTDDQFLAAFRSAVRAGREFRASFDLEAVDVRMYFLYSTSVEMEETTEIVDDDGWYRVKRSRPKEKNGDGRVLMKSAINSVKVDPSLDDAFATKIGSEHGALLGDPGFSDFVSTNLRPYIEDKYASLAVAAILARNLPVGFNRLVHVGDPFKASGDQEYLNAKTRIALYNLSQVGGSSGSTAEMVRVGIAAARASKNPDSAVALLDSVVVVDKTALSITDAAYGAHVATKARKPDKALQFSVFGLEGATYDPTNASDKKAARQLFDMFKKKSKDSSNIFWNFYSPSPKALDSEIFPGASKKESGSAADETPSDLDGRIIPLPKLKH